MRHLKHKDIIEDPFLNPDPLTHWCGPKNLAWIRIDDESCWALLDNGSTVNAVTHESVTACSLDVSLLNNLVDGTLNMNSFGRLSTQPLGYVIIRV